MTPEAELQEVRRILRVPESKSTIDHATDLMASVIAVNDLAEFCEDPPVFPRSWFVKLVDLIRPYEEPPIMQPWALETLTNYVRRVLV